MSLDAFMREQQYWEILRQADRLETHDWPHNMAAKHHKFLASVTAQLSLVANSLYRARQELRLREAQL